MFENVDDKLHVVGKLVFVLGVIASIVLFIIYLVSGIKAKSGGTIGMSIGILFGGSIFSYIDGLIIYGIGDAACSSYNVTTHLKVQNSSSGYAESEKKQEKNKIPTRYYTEKEAIAMVEANKNLLQKGVIAQKEYDERFEEINTHIKNTPRKTINNAPRMGKCPHCGENINLSLLYCPKCKNQIQ